ncbi:MAG: 4-alpha-glucanotransferase [Ilumatobacteraceae bacterium]
MIATTPSKPAPILTSYLDAKAKRIRATPAALEGVRAALGDAGQGRDRALDVVVAWDGVLPALPKAVSVVLESGVEHPDNRAAVPLGYHTLTRSGQAIGTVIAAPRFAPAARPGRWGVFLPLYALRHHHDTSLANYHDLGALFEWLHWRGGDTLLTLPLLPMYLDEPADWSPYSPVSRRMWNELYVNLEAEGAPPATEAPLPVDDLLDYPVLHRLHTARLDALAEIRWHDAALQRFVSEHPLVAKYAAYRGAQARLGRNWRTWKTAPGTLPSARDVDPVVQRRHLVGSWLATRQLTEVADAAAGRGQSLALDVALGAHGDGFDVWNEGDLFVPGVSVGAPPDPVFVGGQDWGFPPVHPARSRATGHRYFRETIRHHLRFATLLRLDHVMGLARQWWVPHGHAATDGAYVSYPLDEMLAITCLEAALAGAVVVGENLGIVPPAVNQGLADHHLLGIHVAGDVLGAYGTKRSIRSTRHEVAMLTTHDGVPFAGWWNGLDVERAFRHGLIDEVTRERRLTRRVDERAGVVGQMAGEGRLHDPTSLGATMVAVAEDLAAQDATIAIFNLEDFWLEDRPQNTPGTFQEEPNWRRTAALTLDDLHHDAGIDETCRRIRTARAQSAARRG